MAQALGVSVSTVSNAFNRPDQLSAALRERVLTEAERLGLTGPNPAARALHTGRSGAVGVIYTDRLSYAFSDPAAVLFLQGVTRECEGAGCELVLIPRSSTAAAEETAVGRSVVDGLIVYSVADDDPVLAVAQARRLPFVVVDQPAWNDQWHWVGIDDEAGAHAIAEHLVELGHRSLAVISTEIDRCRLGGEVTGARRESVSFGSTAARLRGYRRAIAAAGVPWSAVPVYEAVENSLEQGYDLARALLRARVRPTALLAMTDQLALGALRAAHEIGMHVPTDISVAGFDDIPTATLHQPALTTVQQPHERKGELAARTVLEMLTGSRRAARQHILPHALRIRGTTGRR